MADSASEYLSELEQLLLTAKHPRIRLLLQKALNDASIAQHSEVAAVEGNKSSAEEKDILVPPLQGPVKASTAGMSKITNYGWDDSGQFIKLYITSLPGSDELTDSHVKTTITERGLDLEVLNLKGKSFSLVISDLCGPIVPQDSSAKVRNGVVTVRLKKQNPDKWPCLTRTEKRLQDAKKAKTSKPKKDSEPGDGIMSMLRNLYDEGDDDMKRTLAKAWTEVQEKRKKGGNDDMEMPKL